MHFVVRIALGAAISYITVKALETLHHKYNDGELKLPSIKFATKDTK